MHIFKKLILFISLSIVTISNAQINFEPAYYIDNSNTKTEGFIQNVEWLDNPTEIKFKSNKQSESKTLTVENIKEFGIIDGAVYSRYNVSIDKSSNDSRKLSDIRSPEFENETLFLKRVIDGKASLYYYSGFGIKRFFYTLDKQTIKQLVYKRFQNNGIEIRVNESYKQELKNNLSCADINDNTIKNLNYKLSSLITIFKTYNECVGSPTVIYNQISKRTSKQKKITFRIKAGARNNSFSFESPGGITEGELPSKIGFQLGLEGEIIFQFNRNKWSGLIEATYFDYSDEDRIFISSSNQNIEVEYSGIELGFGARHSFFLENDSRLFLNAGLVVPINFNQSLNQTISRDFDEFDFAVSASLGAGFEYKDFSIELKYNTPRTLINDINAEYSSYSVTLGYIIF